MSELSFHSLPLSPRLKEVVTQMGYQLMTPIQAKSIGPLLDRKDVIGQSRTGSGKTAAYSIPMLEQVDTSSRATQGLVVCPTRELCQQVASEVRKLGRYKKDLRVVVISGGHPSYLDRKALEHGAQIIVATPGRLFDHLQRATISLKSVRVVVLDEADRMLDMGFREKIEQILKHSPKERQTALFSATFPTTIEVLSQRFQKDPVRVTVETPQSELPEIEQLFFWADQEQKSDQLINFLKSRTLQSVLVFCNLKVRVDEVVNRLKQAGLAADRLHGNLEQIDREKVMAKFKNHSTRILVATDVAGRGIDVSGLDAVVNYDLPTDPEQYVHRIGRTGRAGAKGLAVSFVTSVEPPRIQRIGQSINYEITVTNLSSATLTPPQRIETTLCHLDTFSISGGRKQKLRPGDILGALTGDIGLKGTQIGKIEILDHISFVAIDRSVARDALAKLKNGKIKGRRFLVQRVQ